MSMIRGRIFNIQRFSLHDGPGIRTTVFLKGCPLRCGWCANPESGSPRPQLAYAPEKCTACGDCFSACPPHALTPDAAGRATIDWNLCTHCGECVPQCAPEALEMVGREMTVDEVAAVVERDRRYYETSGGGVTLSGGEPLVQPQFAAALLRAARAARLHTCVETTGFAPWSAFEQTKDFVDLWLFDFKETDPQLHERFTGRDNRMILERLEQLHACGAKILLRCPIIPDVNACSEHLDGIATLTERLPQLIGVELLSYHDLWRGKLDRFGLPPPLPDVIRPAAPDVVASWKDYLRKRGVRVVG